jgi:hypothetical protein
MIQTINFYDFQTAFNQIRPNNFSYDGLKLLFNYLEEYEEDTGEQIELDVIALCCDFVESSLEEINSNYSHEEALNLENAIEYLRDNTDFIGKTDEDKLVFLQF